MQNVIKQQAQQMTEQTVGKIAVGVGGTGSAFDYFAELTMLADLLVKFGNAVLILGGAYLVLVKIFDKRRNRRNGD